MTRDPDDEIEREILTHLELETEERIAEGMTAEEAHYAARRAFGNVTRVREHVRSVWRNVWLDDIRQDVRYALRMLSRNPGFACVAVLTLAIGIGANTAIFSVINAVLLRPLPFPNADRLVTIIENRPPTEPFDGRPARRAPLADEIRALGTQTTTLADVELYGAAPELRLPGREEEAGLPGARASGPLLTMLGARPVIGRLFATDEQDSVIVLSHEAWQRDFGADPNVVGRTVVIDGGNIPALRTRETYTVVGVVAPGFHFPNEQVRYWMARGGAANIARLKEGVSLQAAASEVGTLLHRIAGKPVLPAGSSPPRFEVVTVKDRLVAPVRPALRVLAVAVGLVLLIACANVANLLLSRAGVRQREMAIRGAVGAGRGRLVRQTLTESTILAAIGGAAGLLIALGALHLLRTLFASLAQPSGGIVRQIGIEISSGAAGTFPRMEEIGLDTTALVFLTFQVRRPPSRSTATELVALSEDLVSALSTAPGVQAAAYAAELPMLQLRMGFGFKTTPGEQLPEREPGPGGATAYYPDVRVVSRDYFGALGIRLIAGRGFRDSDSALAAPVLVVNRELARLRFGGQNPIGAQLYGPGARPWEIVGIVDDVRQQAADRPAEPQVFMEYRQWPVPAFQLSQYYVVRATGDPRALLPAVRGALRSREPEATIEHVATMDELTSVSLARPRVYAVLLGLFAGIAVTLAAIGIYGVMAYTVSQSTREIGIRVALGAERGQVLRLIIGQGMVLTAVGIAIGLAGALAMTRYLQGMLFGVTPLDAPTFVAVAVLFALVAALASYVPARRATAVDPLVALRCE